jgi:hypothetical protein
MNATSKASPHDPASFFNLLRNPLKYRLFLLKKLPAAYFSGLRLPEVSEEKAVVTVPFKWFTLFAPLISPV